MASLGNADRVSPKAGVLSSVIQSFFQWMWKISKILVLGEYEKNRFSCEVW